MRWHCFTAFNYKIYCNNSKCLTRLPLSCERKTRFTNETSLSSFCLTRNFYSSSIMRQILYQFIKTNKKEVSVIVAHYTGCCWLERWKNIITKAWRFLSFIFNLNNPSRPLSIFNSFHNSNFCNAPSSCSSFYSLTTLSTAWKK